MRDKYDPAFFKGSNFTRGCPAVEDRIPVIISKNLWKYITENKRLSEGLDKRTKNLSLTSIGLNLENKLSTIQIQKIKKVINNFNQKDIDGFKKILYEMIEIDNKKTFQHLNE